MTSPLVAALDTAAPEETTALRRWKSRVRAKLSALLLPLLQRVARDHVGGETIDDAMSVARHLAGEDTATTLGFWDAPEDVGRPAVDTYLSVIRRLADSGLDSYVSIKPPALRFDLGHAVEVAAAAARAGLRVHCDSHGVAAAEPSHAMEQAMLAQLPATKLSTTLPGRWSRSLADAEWAIDRGMAVRVVKGQWPDPADPKRDLRAGFLEVIDRLAGRVRHVGVATHDVWLAAEAISRLRAAGTPCELELLFGRPRAQPLKWAHDNGVRVRAYVPFGKGYIPSAVGILVHNPRLALRIVHSLVGENIGRLVDEKRPKRRLGDGSGG